MTPVKQNVFKKYENNFFLFLIPVSLLFIFLIMNGINVHFSQLVAQNKLSSLGAVPTINPYPVAQGTQLLNLTAKTAIVLDTDSQVVIFSKNPELRFSMASTTKIMTALTALDYYKDTTVLTMQSSGVEGSGLNLQVGDQFYFKDLLYAMLLPSANDAAEAIADNYPGGKKQFVAKMNEKAAHLHLTNTHFSDAIGLDDDTDYTTVVDMAHLASVAIQNKELASITATKEKIITNITGSRQYVLTNLNKLLGIDGVNGIKTGTTEGAGEVLVTSTNINGHTFIIVVMNSENRFADTEVLLHFISQNVQFVTPVLPQF